MLGGGKMLVGRVKEGEEEAVQAPGDLKWHFKRFYTHTESAQGRGSQSSGGPRCGPDGGRGW